MCPLQYEKLPNFCHGCGLVGHLVVDCPHQPYNLSIRFQYGDWMRASLKKKQENIIPPKGRIRFHEEGGSSNSQSDFSNLGDDLVSRGDTMFDAFRFTLTLSIAGDSLGVPTAHANIVDVVPL
ncbi:hypothetical protein V6N13_061793 [Hibiscus sabdariffa]